MFNVEELKIRRKSWIRAAGIPKHLQGWEYTDCTSVDQKYLDALQGWETLVQDGKIINAVGKRTCGRGVALYGDPGNGKTTLVAALIQNMMRTSSLDIFELNDVRPCYFTTYAGLIDLKGEMMSDQIEESREMLYEGIMGEAVDSRRNVKVLVLDDVGREHNMASGWNQSMLHHVLRSRFNAGLPTIVTSNIPLMKWQDFYGEATASFAHEAFLNIDLKSAKGDLRR
jgi:DNA replication protein DnaC